MYKRQIHTAVKFIFMILLISMTWVFLDIGEDVAGKEAHTEHAREVTVLTAAFPFQMECVILLQVWNIWVQSHLTQERIRQDIFVVDLWRVRGQWHNHL